MAKQVTSVGHSVLFTLLLFVLVAVSGSPLRNKGCQGRKLGGAETHYEVGHTYVYNFEGHTVTSLPGQQGDGVKLHLKTTAEISIGVNCQGVLNIKGLQVTGPDAQKYSHLEELEGHPVEFDFESGAVGKDLLTAEQDSEASVNLHRAVLSLFQTSPQEKGHSSKSIVVDVFGQCPTEFGVSDRGSTAYVTKFRNLNNCHHRENLRQDFTSVAYHVQSDFQSTPLLEATHEVKQQLKGGILSSAESHERYLYKPFSNQDAGAKTLVETKLTLVSHAAKPASAVSGNTVVRSIVFEPPHMNTGSSNAAAVVEALHKAHAAMPQYVGETAAKEFANVVSVMRHTSKNDLLAVYSQVRAGAGFKDKSAGTKMFLDALFRAGTGDAIEVAVELLKSNKITGPAAELYYLQFAYTKHVTKAALTAAVTLLELPNPSKLAYLGIGALGGRYCAEHACDGVPEVDAFLEKLSHGLDGGCKVSSYDEEVKVVATLKALHNVHHLNEAVINKLKTCVLDEHVPTRVRAAVLDVFQSDACKVKEISLEVLKNIQLDSELRIKAFLALVECPCNKMANPLKELLDAEPSYQVGSFIASYLRNLRATTNPGKEHQKKVYGEIRSVKRFPIDFRKFSSNFEHSYLLGGLNVGTTAESNLIYSQKSFLPRVSSLNLTSEVFGHSINFLEVELRQENLDLLAESLFGPKGYFSTVSLEEVVKNGKEKWTDLENTVKQRLHHAIRGKRSTAKELYDVKDKSTSPFASEPDREILLELSTRLFGAEVGWLTFHHNAKDAANNAFDAGFKILEAVAKKLKDFDYKMRQHTTFLDTEFVYPTAVGFPLKLVASGSSAVHIELEGKIDLDKLVNDYKNSELHFKLVPSAAIEVIGALEVDAYAVEAGLKVATTLHTATGTDIAIKSTGGVGFDITVGLPVQKQDILTVKSEVLSTVQERGKPEVDKEVAFPNIPKRSYHGCFDQLSRLVGLTFCGTMSFPWDPVASKAAFFPLNGGSKFSLVIENEDVKQYHFRASVNNADPHKKSLELLLETPGSQTDRKLELLLERTYEPYQGLKAELSSPWKKVSAEVAFTDSDTELSLLAKATNDADEYYMKIGAQVSGDPSHATYHPVLEYKTPQKFSNFVAKKGTKGRPEKLSQPFSVSGSVTVDRSVDSRKYTFNDVVFTTPQGEYKVEGTVGHESKKAFNTDLKIHYGEHHVVLKSDFRLLAPQNYHVALNVQPSQYPDFKVNLIWDFSWDKHNVKNSLALIHGSDPNSDLAKFTLDQEAHYQFEDYQHFDFSTKNKVTYPLLGIVGKFDIAAAPKQLSVGLEGSYEKHKFESNLVAKTGIKQPGDYDIDFSGKVLDNSLTFESKREVISPKQSKFTTEIEIKPGGKYTLTADVTHVFSRNDIDFQVDAVANIHGQQKEYKLDAGLVHNPHLFDTHYKVTVGDVEYVDISASFKKAPGENPSGNAKLFLKNYLVGNAQYKYANGKGSATLNVDIPKLGRKLKGTGDLQVTGTHHVANVELFYNVEKNPNQKITFHTDTDFKKDALDSKNKLNVLNYITEFNVKGTLTGKLEDGQLKGDFDLTLPNDYKFGGKLDQTLHVRQTNSEADVNVELTVAAPHYSQPSKITFEFAAKNVDTKQYSFDGQSKLAYHSPTGKDVSILVAGKNIPQREQRVIEGQGVLQGSLIGDPLRVEFSSEVHEPYVTFKTHGSYGTGTVVDIYGKVSRTLKYEDGHYSGPFLLEMTEEVKLPFEKFKHIKDTASLQGEVQKNKFQFKYNEQLEIDEKVFKIHIESNTQEDKGENKVVVTLPNTEPKTYVSTWYFNPEEYKNNGLVKGGFTLSSNQDTKLTVDVNGKKDWTDYDLHATLHTPHEKLKNAELTLKNKYIPSLELDTDFVLVVDDKKVTIVNKVTRGPFPGFPNIDFTATHPEGKTRVYLFLQSKSPNDVSGKAELEWATNGGGKLTASGKANYESLQNFKLEADVESAKLNLKKWHVLLANKPAKSGKTVVIQATEAGTQVINGRLEYNVEDKEHLYKVGVSGNVKVRNQNQPLKAFVYINKYVPAEHGEIGVKYGVSIRLGEKSFEALTKQTNKESRGSFSICSEANKCSEAEVHSVINTVDVNHLQHDFGAKVDLRACGIKDGFVLVGKTTTEHRSFEHSVELKILNAKQTTYKLQSHLNDHDLGFVVTLPHRVIALEGKLAHVKGTGEFTLDLNFWLDKERHPENKAGLHVLSLIDSTKDRTQLKGDVVLSHPALQKDFSIRSNAVLFPSRDTVFDGSVELDIFAKSSQKITLNGKLQTRDPSSDKLKYHLELSAKGKFIDINYVSNTVFDLHHIDCNSKLTYVDEKHKTKTVDAVFKVSLEEINIYVKSPTAELVKIDRKLTRNGDNVKLVGEAVLIGMDPIVFEQDITLFVRSHSILYFKSKPNNKLIVDLLHDIMKGFSLKLTTLCDGKTTEVFHVGVDLTDEHFLKPQFEWSTADAKSLVDLLIKELQEGFKKSEAVSKDFVNEVTDEIQGFLESVKKAQPDFGNLASSYKNQLKELKEELENDEALAEASENVKKVIQAFTKVIVELTKRITELADQSLELVNKLNVVLHEAANKFFPKLREFYAKILDIVDASLVRGTVDFAKSVIDIAARFIQENEDELKKIASVVKDFFEDAGKIFGPTVVQVRDEVVGFVKILLEQLSNFPIYSALKEQFHQFKSHLSPHYLVPENTWSVIKEVIGPFKDSLPTAELKDFVSSVEEYVDKHLNKQPVNDAEEIQALLNKALKALNSLLTFLTDHLPKGDPTKEAPSFLGLRLPVGIKSLLDLPKVVALKYSPLQWFTSGNLRDLPTFQEFLLSLKPSLNPRDWIPPFRAHGTLIEMQHFVTLDGRHFTFKGTCEYILIQDVVDGNFSVALDYATKSLTVADHHDTVELFYDSKIKVNGQPAEFPSIVGDFAAWKDFGSVGLWHKAGLYIKCDTHYSYCLFHVNGFYFGKTQGLLGVLDYEPYDDFREPNGKIVSNVNEFGNSWKVNPSCGDVSGPTHHDHEMPEPPECGSLFGGSSPLKLGYLVSPVAPYREACSHIVADAATADAKKQGACAAAAAYVSSARSQYFPISLPAECAHCSVVGGNPLPVRDSVSVRVPQKAADVVIVVEQVTTNSELFKDLISPLVSTLTTELKTKGITDVHFTLIGYGDATYKYPAVYTTSGKISFEGKTKNIKFTERVDPFSEVSWFKYLKAVIEAEFGLGEHTRAYQFAAKYPFKVATSKALIGVLGTTKTSPYSLSLQQLGALYSTKVLRDRGISFHLVAPVEDLHLENSDAKTLKSVVGFDSDRVYVLSDAKKKDGGNYELRKNLSYKNNIWIPIALESHGTAYVAQNFVEKASARKQFLQVFSHRIVDSLLQPLHQDCTCKLVEGLYPFADCKVTNRVEREHLSSITKGVKGVKG